MFGFLKKKKNKDKADNASQDTPEREARKPIYKPLGGSTASMIAVICPFCDAELAQLYYMRVDTFSTEVCPHCGGTLDIH